MTDAAGCEEILKSNLQDFTGGRGLRGESSIPPQGGRDANLLWKLLKIIKVWLLILPHTFMHFGQ